MFRPNPNLTQRRWSSLARGAALALLVLLIYSPVYKAGYLWDDTVMLTENRFVKSDDGLIGIWTGKTVDFLPVTLSLLWLEWRAFGPDPAGYHVVNVLLHVLGSILLWRVLLRLKVPGAWWGALLFAVHPVCVGSVAWIAERKNTLSMVFYLLSLLFYLKSEDVPRNADDATRPAHSTFSMLYWVSFTLFALGILSKSSVVILPVVILLCLWWQRGAASRPFPFAARDFLRLAPFFVAALIISAVTVWFQMHRSIGDSPIPGDPFVVRVLGGSWAVWFYLGNSLLPLNLSMVYPRWTIDPTSVISYLPGLAWIGLLFLLWRLGCCNDAFRAAAARALFFVLAYFWITLWPVLGVFDMYFLVYAQAADHWQYLSVISICAFSGALAAALMGKARERSRPLTHCLTLLLTLVVVLLSLLTWKRARVFTSSETLWRDTVQKNPRAWVAHNNLGNALEEKGDSAAALQHHTEALRLGPHSPDTHYNVAKHFARLGQLDQAESHYRTALKISPAYVKAHNNLGILLEATGRADEAFSHYAEAVRLHPGYAVAQNNLSQVLLKRGKVADALAHGLLAVQLQPDFAEAHYNVANAYSFQRNAPESTRHFQEALRLRPQYPEAHYNFGNLLAAQGKISEAREEFRATLRLRPDFADAQNNLGNTFAVQGKWAEAASCYEEVLRLDPAHAIAPSSLGYALFRLERFAEAQTHFAAALKKNPNSPDDHFHLGNVLARLGQNYSAQTHYAGALRLRPNFPDVQFQSALLFMAEKKNAEAVKQLRAALQGRPNWSEALNNLAWILATSREENLRNGSEALTLANRAVEISRSNPGALDTLAAAQADLQQFAEAVNTAQKAVALAEATGDETLAREIRARLQLYQSGQAYRD